MRIRTTSRMGPWLANGVTDVAGTTVLRNVVTRRDVAVASTRRAVTDCSPSWCRVAALGSDGSTRIEYRAGVLRWSTGNQGTFVRHSVDLRTV